MHDVDKNSPALMTEGEIYEFNLNGYIVYRDVGGGDNLGPMNEVLDRHVTIETHGHFQFLGWGSIFMELMVHPRTLHIMRAIIGDWLRLDHAYDIQIDEGLRRSTKISMAACGPTRVSTSISGRTARCGTVSSS